MLDVRDEQRLVSELGIKRLEGFAEIFVFGENFLQRSVRVDLEFGEETPCAVFPAVCVNVTEFGLGVDLVEVVRGHRVLECVAVLGEDQLHLVAVVSTGIEVFAYVVLLYLSFDVFADKKLALCGFAVGACEIHLLGVERILPVVLEVERVYE